MWQLLWFLVPAFHSTYKFVWNHTTTPSNLMQCIIILISFSKYTILTLSLSTSQKLNNPCVVIKNNLSLKTENLFPKVIILKMQSFMYSTYGITQARNFSQSTLRNQFHPFWDLLYVPIPLLKSIQFPAILLVCFLYYLITGNCSFNNQLPYEVPRNLKFGQFYIIFNIPI